MRSKVLSKQTLLSTAIFFGLSLFLSLFFYSISQGVFYNDLAKIVENTSAIPSQEQAVSGFHVSPTGNPARIKIPKLNVDAPFEYVGLTLDGAMDIPKDPDTVAWFNLGPRPGESGSAVVAGHYGWKNNIPAAFDNLHKLRKGDKIYIEDDKGEVVSFVMRESRMYNPNADASDVFGSLDGKSYLNLITCGGVWDKASKTYSKRLVVFTDKE